MTEIKAVIFLEQGLLGGGCDYEDIRKFRSVLDMFTIIIMDF